MTARPTLDALTGARFWAAIYVVAYHYSRAVLADAPLPVRQFVSSGLIGVDFFFILSGFVLAYNYLDGRPLDRRRFWIGRFARIYPAYLLAVALVVPFVFQAAPTPLAPLGDLALVLGLVQAWLPDKVFLWNGPAWTLSVEAFFYAVFPFLGLALARLPRRGLGIALAGCCLLTFVGPMLAHYIRPAHIAVHNPLLRLPEFLIGVLLSRLFLAGVRIPWSGGVAVLALGSLGSLLLLGPSLWDRPILSQGVLMVLFACIIYSLAQGQGMLVRVLSTRTMVVLGGASYAIYILQQPIASLFWKVGGDTIFNSPLILLGYVALLLGVAILSGRLVEEPLGRAIRRTLAVHPQPVAGLAPGGTRADL